MTIVGIEELFVKTFIQSILYGSESWNFTIPIHHPWPKESKSNDDVYIVQNN